jgi:hypothetical protein
VATSDFSFSEASILARACAMLAENPGFDLEENPQTLAKVTIS